MTERNQQEMTSLLKKQVSRRDVLKAAGIGGVGMLLGATGVGGAIALADVFPSSQKRKIQMISSRFTVNIRPALRLKCKTIYILLHLM